MCRANDQFIHFVCIWLVLLQQSITRCGFLILALKVTGSLKKAMRLTTNAAWCRRRMTNTLQFTYKLCIRLLVYSMRSGTNKHCWSLTSVKWTVNNWLHSTTCCSCIYLLNVDDVTCNHRRRVPGAWGAQPPPRISAYRRLLLSQRAKQTQLPSSVKL